VNVKAFLITGRVLDPQDGDAADVRTHFSQQAYEAGYELELVVLEETTPAAEAETEEA
jgi:hypothetical protein